MTRAATTSFSSATLADNGSNLDNSTPSGGTILSAINFTNTAQSSPETSPTINGIPFTAFNVPGTASVSGTNFTLVSNSSNTLIRDDNRAAGRPTTAAIYPLIYNAIVSPSASGTPAASIMTLTLQNLTIGQQYEVQMAFSSGDAVRQVNVNDNAASSSTPATTGTISYGTTNGPKVATGLFTADAASQALFFAGGAGELQLQQLGEQVALGVKAVRREHGRIERGVGVLQRVLARQFQRPIHRPQPAGRQLQRLAPNPANGNSARSRGAK